jgi:hypothetical protein
MVVITRVINASAVIEFNEGAVLTDPYFTDHWFMRFNEPIGVRDLPNLAAIIGRSFCVRSLAAVFFDGLSIEGGNTRIRCNAFYEGRLAGQDSSKQK